MMKILAIDTSCDETAVAITEGRKVLSNIIYSQILIHKKWGGVVPSLAKRAHQERIDWVIAEALRKFNQQNVILNDSEGSLANASSNKLRDSSAKSQNDNDMRKIDAIAVTYGPGLAVALEVGIAKAKELAKKYKKKLIAVGHMEGHIYANFGQNAKGNPKREQEFPYLCLLISGGHTELVILKNQIEYEVIGETIDDAAGEALDKAAKMLGLGYPGGPVLERLAREVENKDFHNFPRPMMQSKDLNFSFSGLKTALFYHLKRMSDEDKAKDLKELASSFQEAVFDSLVKKLEKAIVQTKINRLLVGGGVSANMTIRNRLRILMKKYDGEAIFPPYKYLCTDNAAMIGIAASYHAEKGDFIRDLEKLDRVPRLRL